MPRFISRLARRLAAAIPLAAVLTAACFHASNNRPERDPRVITQDEIDRAGATDALNLITRLRGDFLVNRGRVSLNTNASAFPTVFVDGVRYGDATILKQIPASQVGTIRLYRAAESQSRFGNDNTAGVIEVITRR